MNRRTILIAVAAATVLIALAVGSGTARATYPGSNNGRLTFAMTVGGNVDVYLGELVNRTRRLPR